MINDTSKGNISQHIWQLFVPIFIVDFFYILQIVIERIWAGKILGQEALGLLAISVSVIMIISAINIAFITSAQIFVSHLVGSKQERRIPEIFMQIFILTVSINLLLWFGCLAFYDGIVEWLHAPEAIRLELKLFLKILFLGSNCACATSFLVAIWTSLGNSKFASKYALFTLFLNTILTPLLMMGVPPFPKLGILGAAYGFTIAQVIGVVIFYYQSHKKNPLIRFAVKLQNLRHTIAKITRYALPLCAQNIAVAGGMLFVQKFVDLHGSSAIASFSIVVNIDNFIFLFAMAIANSSAVIIGHNKGSQQYDRVNECLKQTLQIACITSAAVLLLTWIFAAEFAGLFIQKSNTELLSLAVSAIRILTPGYLFLAAILIFNGYFIGLGRTTAVMFLSAIAIWGLRVPLAKFLPLWFGLNGIWMGITASFVIGFLLYLTYFFWLQRSINSKA